MLIRSFKIWFLISVFVAFASCEGEDDSNFNVITFASIVGKYKGLSMSCTTIINTQDTTCSNAINNTLTVTVMNNQHVVTDDELDIYGLDTLILINTETINEGRQFSFANHNLNLIYREKDKEVTLERIETYDNANVVDIFEGKK